MAVQGELLVGSDVKQATGGVVGAGGEGKSIREKLEQKIIMLVTALGWAGLGWAGLDSPSQH